MPACPLYPAPLPLDSPTAPARVERSAADAPELCPGADFLRDGRPHREADPAHSLDPAVFPAPTVVRPRDPLPRGPHGESAVTAAGLLAVEPGDARTLGRRGRPHPRRFALGPYTDARASDALAGTPAPNASVFRHNGARATLVFPRRLSCRGALCSRT